MRGRVTRYSLLDTVLRELSSSGLVVPMEVVARARRLLEEPRYTKRGFSLVRLVAIVACVLNEAGLPVPFWVVASGAGLSGRSYRAVLAEALTFCNVREGVEHARVLAFYASSRLGLDPDTAKRVAARAVELTESGASPSIRLAVAVALREVGVSYEKIERVLGVSHHTLLGWYLKGKGEMS